MRLSLIFITGSTDGLGREAALSLLSQGHKVVVHARNRQRLDAVQDLIEQGAQAVVGDLSDLKQVKEVAEQVNKLGRMDAIIHNAAVNESPQVLTVNVVAPYILTALITVPNRLIYLSSSMHFGGRLALKEFDFTKQKSSASYSDSKLCLTAFAAAIARLWPTVVSSSVDPGWVPTKMGGPSAPDDLQLGHKTQEWLATSDEAEALVSGAYWHYQRRIEPRADVHDQSFQDELLHKLEAATGIALP